MPVGTDLSRPGGEEGQHVGNDSVWERVPAPCPDAINRSLPNIPLFLQPPLLLKDIPKPHSGNEKGSRCLDLDYNGAK